MDKSNGGEDGCGGLVAQAARLRARRRATCHSCYTFDMHHDFIRRCLELAEEGRGHVSPNPLVGCVIVSDGAVITEGAHRSFGGAHAEREALIKAGELAKGATLYSNLEPCCTQGKQPPCTDMIIAAGIKTVVFGAGDTSQNSTKILRSAGIEVIGPIPSVETPIPNPDHAMALSEVGTPWEGRASQKQTEQHTFWNAMEAECRRYNRGFFSLVEKGRPWVTLKKAMRRDGSIEGKITDEEQDAWAHRNLRATHDAILVGSKTIIADNPQLNVRCITRNQKPETSNGTHPRRIILDPHAEIPPDATVLTDADANRTLVIREKLSIPKLLERLTNEGIASVLVEGGPKVWQSFEESGLIDEVVILTKQSPY
jgi:diaminohydroxyphosphoribosylaminopyrimidine deaminase / 5-amino-6-(5-phosphoribosylamino)uracil reductase